MFQNESIFFGFKQTKKSKKNISDIQYHFIFTILKLNVINVDRKWPIFFSFVIDEIQKKTKALNKQMTNMNDFVVNLKLTKKMDLDSKMWFFIFGEKKQNS